MLLDTRETNTDSGAAAMLDRTSAGGPQILVLGSRGGTKLNSKSHMARPMERQAPQIVVARDRLVHTIGSCSSNDGVDVAPPDRVSAEPRPHCLSDECRHAGQRKACRTCSCGFPSPPGARQSSLGTKGSSRDKGCPLPKGSRAYSSREVLRSGRSIRNQSTGADRHRSISRCQSVLKRVINIISYQR